ncbi:MAG: DinB family protein [Anaerolineaceae bacterium]|nr:DinB family protein [Anaerolineaceae bacterium]MBN2677762.1 DinB family protein [Anaerolineaceae bacterium]
MITKPQLFSTINTTLQEFRELGSLLPAEALNTKGSLTHWAVRDDVIHCAYYIQQFADRMTWPRDHARMDDNDYLKVNDEVWTAHQTENWMASLDMLEKACGDMITRLQPLSEAELNDVKAFTWMGGQSVADYVTGLVYVHGMMHIQYAFIREGMVDAAIASADKVYQMVEALVSSEAGRGRNLYNKACSYALAGRKADAIKMVMNAVKIAPNLLEWSRKDSDLDCLRDDPEFQAIYQQNPHSLEKTG